MRKPIQIAALRFGKPLNHAEQESIETELVVLCDDGTIWTMLGTDSDWVPLPRIPQDTLREDWLAEVAGQLTNEYAISKDDTPAFLDEYSSELRAAFNRHDSPQESARVVSDLIYKNA